jgi:hypothetical protein
MSVSVALEVPVPLHFPSIGHEPFPNAWHCAYSKPTGSSKATWDGLHMNMNRLTLVGGIIGDSEILRTFQIRTGPKIPRQLLIRIGSEEQ